MSVIMNSVKEGHNLWKKVWLTEFLMNLFFSVIVSLLFIPITLLIITSFVSESTEITDKTDISLYLSSVQENPLFLSALALYFFVGYISLIVFIGISQRITHEYQESEKACVKDSIKKIKSDFFPLVIIGIGMLFMIMIPNLFVLLILGSVPLLVSVIQVIIGIIVVLPLFLAPSAVIKDNKSGLNAIKCGWKKYFNNYFLLIITLIIVYIPLGAIGISLLMISKPLFDSLIIFLLMDPIILFLGSILLFLLIIHIVLVVQFLFSLFSVVLYSLYCNLE